MSKSIDTIIHEWARGEAGVAYSSHRTVWRCGETLYSRQLAIGQRDRDGTRRVLNVMQPNYLSGTTSHHVSKAKRYADVIVEPVCFPNARSRWNRYGWPKPAENKEQSE